MFYYPPRPEQAIPPGLIASFESRGYIAQKKKNGTCQVITIDNDGNVTFKTRRNEDNKAWKPTTEIINQLSGFKNTVTKAEVTNREESPKSHVRDKFQVKVIRLEDFSTIYVLGNASSVIQFLLSSYYIICAAIVAELMTHCYRAKPH